jgi:hypothetical protein
MRKALIPALFLLPALSTVNGQPSTVSSVSWLTGCWEASNATRKIIERWDAPASGEMKGMSRRTSAAGVISEPERLRLFMSRDTLVYEAFPPGQALTQFRVKTMTAQEIVFENLAHDFPQRIVYTRSGADSVIARIEGDRAGQRQPVNYPYKKAACTPDTPTAREIAVVELEPFYKDLEAKEASLSSTNAWFAANAGPGFFFAIWTSQATTTPTATAEVLARSSELQRNSPAVQALRDRTYRHTLGAMTTRGDTVALHVTVYRGWKFPDTGGRYGAAGEFHERRAVERRIDTWFKVGGAWKLRESAFIGDEVQIDGKITQRDGRPVTP